MIAPKICYRGHCGRRHGESESEFKFESEPVSVSGPLLFSSSLPWAKRVDSDHNELGAGIKDHLREPALRRRARRRRDLRRTGGGRRRMGRVATFFGLTFGVFVFLQSMETVHHWLALYLDEKVFPLTSLFLPWFDSRSASGSCALFRPSA